MMEDDILKITRKIESRTNNNTALQLNGYSEEACVQLIKKVEQWSDGEEAILFCSEATFIRIFNNCQKFSSKIAKKFGVHNIIVNEKKLNRFMQSFNFTSEYGIILICADETKPTGIIVL
jgi:hypothetical protein